MTVFKRLYKFFQKRYYRVVTEIRNKSVLRRMRKHKEEANYEERIENIITKPVEETTQLIDEAANALAIAEIKPFLEILEVRPKRRKRIFELHELKTEITRLNSNFIQLDLKQRKIQFTNSVDTNFIERQVENLTEIVEKHNSKGKLELSTITLSEFNESIKELEKILSNDSTVKRFYQRETERKQKQKKEKEKFHTQLSTLENLIRQNNISEAQKLISILERTLTPTIYIKEKTQFQKEKEKFRERELKNFQRQQEEILKRHDEETDRLRIAEKARLEEAKLLQEQKLLLLKQQEDAKNKKEKALKSLLNKKGNWQDFKNVLEEKSISTLYHFTDRANLKSIKNKGGLYSWQYCDKNGISIPYPGGDSLSRQLDERYHLQDYVRASFCKSHPMMYTARNRGWINDPVILEIRIDICFFEQSQFSNMNATDNLHSSGDSLEFLQGLHFQLFHRNYFDLDVMSRKYYQAEVLVKTWIPIKFITNINEF